MGVHTLHLMIVIEAGDAGHTPVQTAAPCHRQHRTPIKRSCSYNVFLFQENPLSTIMVCQYSDQNLSCFQHDVWFRCCYTPNLAGETPGCFGRCFHLYLVWGDRVCLEWVKSDPKKVPWGELAVFHLARVFIRTCRFGYCYWSFKLHNWAEFSWFRLFYLIISLVMEARTWAPASIQLAAAKFRNLDQAEAVSSSRLQSYWIHWWWLQGLYTYHIMQLKQIQIVWELLLFLENWKLAEMEIK